MSRQMKKRVSIQKRAIRDWYELNVETDERGVFYFVSQKGRKKLEVFRRRGGGVIIMTPMKAIYCKSMRLEVEPNGILSVETCRPKMTLKIY